jgi:hypothetical protein
MYKPDENYVIDDIEKAIRIVNEGLDDKIHSFPPGPVALEEIFTGKHKKGINKDIRVRYKFPYGIWFRGHPRSCYNLEPTLFREHVHEELICDEKRKHCIDESRDLSYYSESSMLKHFMLRVNSNNSGMDSTLDWLCLMQHYGIPTRLLDWTESILIALYFAVKEKNECDGYIFALNGARLNILTRIGKSRKALCSPDSVDVILRSELANAHSLKTLVSNLRKKNLLEYVFENITDEKLIKDLRELKIYNYNKPLSQELSLFIEKLSLPIAFYPSRKNDRMANQLSVFTMSGGKTYDQVIIENFGKSIFRNPVSLVELDDKLKNDGNYEEKKFLKCFRIPGNCKLRIREQLKRVGIHDASMYPELEYQANYIKKQWRIIEDRNGKYL